LSAPVAIGLRVVADFADDDFGTVQRQVVEPLVEALAVAATNTVELFGRS
jgi:hypothetical protein